MNSEMEFVRPTEERQGYWRRRPDRTMPSPAQQRCREQFRERAKETRGLTGTVVLPDGRVISRTAYEMAGNGWKSQEALPAPQPAQTNTPIDQTKAYPAKSQITPSVPQGQEAPKRISMEDLIEAITLSRAVQEGKISRHVALLRMIRKI